MSDTKSLRKKDTRRWRRRKDARPGEIVHAALECFSERGFAATKLDDVAERAGVTKGTVYLYFDSKEELFKSVVKEELVPNIVRIEKVLNTEEFTAAESLRRLLHFWAGTFAGSKLSALPKLVLAEVGNFPELAEFYLEEVIGRGFKLIGGILRRGIENGEFRPVDIDNTVFCVIAPAVVSMLWKHTFEPYGKRRIDIEALFETHIEMILTGLKTKETA